MKRMLPTLLALLTGCLVQSFCPFYTEKSVVLLPQLNGDWDAVMKWGLAVTATNSPPWRIYDHAITTYYERSPSDIFVTFFKLGNQLFCDSTIGTTDNLQHRVVRAWHMRSVHVVTKIETNGDLLAFKPLDIGWLTNQMALGKVSLPCVTRAQEENLPLFTATSAQWESFLATYANDTNAFPDTHSYVLKRHASK